MYGENIRVMEWYANKLEHFNTPCLKDHDEKHRECPSVITEDLPY